MKKLFSVLAVLFSVFLISCSTDIPEKEKEKPINASAIEVYKPLDAPPTPVYCLYLPDTYSSPAATFRHNGSLEEVIYCDSSGGYTTTRKIDLSKCQSHEFECAVSDCKDDKKHRIIAKAGFGVSNEGNIKEEVYQDRIYTCKYCSFRYRIHHNKNYQTKFFNDFLKKLEGNCPARPKEKSNE